MWHTKLVWQNLIRLGGLSGIASDNQELIQLSIGHGTEYLQWEGGSYFPYIILNGIETMMSQLAMQSSSLPSGFIICAGA